MACCMATGGTFNVGNIADAGSGTLYTSVNNFRNSYIDHMTPVSRKMCSWAAPQFSRAGESADRAGWVAAQAALAISMIALSTHVQNKQYEIAKAYTDIAEDKWKRFRDKYAPLERRMLNESSGTPEPTVDYNDARNRAAVANDFAFGDADKQLSKYAKLYALCLDPTQDLSRARSLSRTDSVNFNYRDAENFNYYRSDKRWNRRSDILNLGRGNAPAAFSHAQSANSAFSGVASALQQAGNGLSGLIGYLFNRNTTSYPTTFSMATPFGNGMLMSGGM